jgi:hypothetical protein
MSERDGLMATQGRAWPRPWGQRQRKDTTGRPCGGNGLRLVGHRAPISSVSKLMDDDYQSNFDGLHLPN